MVPEFESCFNRKPSTKHAKKPLNKVYFRVDSQLFKSFRKWRNWWL